MPVHNLLEIVWLPTVLCGLTYRILSNSSLAEFVQCVENGGSDPSPRTFLVLIGI